MHRKDCGRCAGPSCEGRDGIDRSGPHAAATCKRGAHRARLRESSEPAIEVCRHRALRHLPRGTRIDRGELMAVPVGGAARADVREGGTSRAAATSWLDTYRPRGMEDRAACVGAARVEGIELPRPSQVDCRQCYTDGCAPVVGVEQRRAGDGIGSMTGSGTISSKRAREVRVRWGYGNKAPAIGGVSVGGDNGCRESTSMRRDVDSEGLLHMQTPRRIDSQQRERGTACWISVSERQVRRDEHRSRTGPLTGAEAWLRAPGVEREAERQGVEGRRAGSDDWMHKKELVRVV
ncbi:hypothetical protein DFH06DRAFT_1136721 [Mycena polygramma]|nr:hypothetical protein DFH06DRAFT_1136721 [Mycena polygramma]